MDNILKSKKYDAILVAGEGKNSYKVSHQHKAFLRVEGQSMVSYVLRALQQVDSIQNIYVVGPKIQLMRHLAEDRIDLQAPKTITILEQRENLFENVWHTFLLTLPEPIAADQLETSPYRNRAVLVVPCDAPLITPHEIEYFIQNCDMENHDHVLGLTPETALRPFYPGPGQPGIKMAYLHLKENIYRINNLHLVKPLQMKNRHYIQQMYQYRYQRNLINVGRFALKLIGKDKRNRFGYYLGLLLGLMFSRLKLDGLVDFFRSWVPKKGLEECISNIMQTRFVGLEVPFPGAALDVDNSKDYETLKLRFQEWRNTLRQLETQHPLPHGTVRTLARKKPAPKVAANLSFSKVDGSATG
ncbi:MAG: hypothetical protein E2O44_03210 [Nitrospina sp.]|nr:MAG: hypothetical protein E2O44_03210 [Nitrospina sp.]